MPEIYVIGGCNGSGKTTFALNIFPNLDNVEFINAEREALASPVVEDNDLRVRAASQPS